MKKFTLDEDEHLVDLRNFCMIKVDEFLGNSTCHELNFLLDCYEYNF